MYNMIRSSIFVYFLIGLMLISGTTGCRGWYQKKYLFRPSIHDRATIRALAKENNGKDFNYNGMDVEQKDNILKITNLGISIPVEDIRINITDADILGFSNDIKLSLRKRMNFAKFARLSSGTIQMLSAAAGASFGIIAGSDVETVSALSAVSAIMPKLQSIWQARARAVAYGDGLELIDEAESRYFAARVISLEEEQEQERKKRAEKSSLSVVPKKMYLNVADVGYFMVTDECQLDIAVSSNNAVATAELIGRGVDGEGIKDDNVVEGEIVRDKGRTNEVKKVGDEEKGAEKRGGDAEKDKIVKGKIGGKIKIEGLKKGVAEITVASKSGGFETVYVHVLDELETKDDGLGLVSINRLTKDGVRLMHEIAATIKTIDKVILSHIPTIEDLKAASGELQDELSNLKVKPDKLKLAVGDKGNLLVVFGGPAIFAASSNVTVAKIENFSAGSTIQITGEKKGRAEITVANRHGHSKTVDVEVESQFGIFGEEDEKSITLYKGGSKKIEINRGKPNPDKITIQDKNKEPIDKTNSVEVEKLSETRYEIIGVKPGTFTVEMEDKSNSNNKDSFEVTVIEKELTLKIVTDEYTKVKLLKLVEKELTKVEVVEKSGRLAGVPISINKGLVEIVDFDKETSAFSLKAKAKSSTNKPGKPGQTPKSKIILIHGIKGELSSEFDVEIFKKFQIFNKSDSEKEKKVYVGGVLKEFVIAMGTPDENKTKILDEAEKVLDSSYVKIEKANESKFKITGLKTGEFMIRMEDKDGNKDSFLLKVIDRELTIKIGGKAYKKGQEIKIPVRATSKVKVDIAKSDLISAKPTSDKPEIVMIADYEVKKNTFILNPRGNVNDSATITIKHGLNGEFSTDFKVTIIPNDEIAKLADALKYWSLVLTKNPQSSKAYFNIGNIHNKLMDYARAINNYNRAIDKLDRKDAITYFYRGNAYADSEKFEDAIKDYNKAIEELSLKKAVAYLRRGDAYIMTMLLDGIKKAKLLLPETGDRALLLLHECIVMKLLGEDTTECEARYKEILKQDFTVTWNFETFESWLKKAKIQEEAKKFITEKSMMLKQHQG